MSSSDVRSAGGPRKTRAEWYAIVKPLRDDGLTGLEIARRTGLASTWVYELLNDPDGSRAKARKDRNRKPCPECGKPTAPETPKTDLCRGCYDKKRAARHGTKSKYRTGCRCEACREANRIASYERRHAGLTPPTHGDSGYRNYGCRCPICTRANTERTYGYKRRFTIKQRAARKAA